MVYTTARKWWASSYFPSTHSKKLSKHLNHMRTNRKNILDFHKISISWDCPLKVTVNRPLVIVGRMTGLAESQNKKSFLQQASGQYLKTTCPSIFLLGHFLYMVLLLLLPVCSLVLGWYSLNFVDMGITGGFPRLGAPIQQSSVIAIHTVGAI